MPWHCSDCDAVQQPHAIKEGGRSPGSCSRRDATSLKRASGRRTRTEEGVTGALCLFEFEIETIQSCGGEQREGLLHGAL